MKYLIRLVVTAFIFFSFFPYLCIGRCAASDLQPYSLALAVLMIALGKFSVPRTLLPVYWIALLTSCIALGRAESMLEIRAALGNVSLFIYTGIFFHLYIHYRRLLVEGAALALFLWFFFGLLEILTFKDLLIPLLGNMRTDPTRSVTSLGPEPSQFGIILILNGVLLSLFLKGRNSTVLVTASFLSAFVLSKSAVVAGVGSIVLLIYYFQRKHLLPMIGIAISLYGYMVSLSRTEVPSSRISTLLETIGHDPMSILARDGSVNDRIGNIFGSLASYYESGGTPFYFENWKKFVEDFVFKYRIFSENPFFTKDMVLSTLGNMLFSTGIFGLILALYVGTIVALANEQPRRKALRVFLAILIGFTLLPLSLNTPVLGAILAVSLHKFERAWNVPS